MNAGRIESARIRGFRSLADVELAGLQNANVLIGANGSGKSNFVRFFEMMSWMLDRTREPAGGDRRHRIDRSGAGAGRLPRSAASVAAAAGGRDARADPRGHPARGLEPARNPPPAEAPLGP